MPRTRLNRRKLLALAAGSGYSVLSGCTGLTQVVKFETCTGSESCDEQGIDRDIHELADAKIGDTYDYSPDEAVIARRDGPSVAVQGQMKVAGDITCRDITLSARFDNHTLQLIVTSNQDIPTDGCKEVLGYVFYDATVRTAVQRVTAVRVRHVSTADGTTSTQLDATFEV